jgi:hypothetical protein
MQSHNMGVNTECGSGGSLRHNPAFYQEGLSKALVRTVSVLTDSKQA